MRQTIILSSFQNLEKFKNPNVEWNPFLVYLFYFEKNAQLLKVSSLK